MANIEVVELRRMVENSGDKIPLWLLAKKLIDASEGVGPYLEAAATKLAEELRSQAISHKANLDLKKEGTGEGS